MLTVPKLSKLGPATTAVAADLDPRGLRRICATVPLHAAVVGRVQLLNLVYRCRCLSSSREVCCYVHVYRTIVFGLHSEKTGLQRQLSCTLAEAVRMGMCVLHRELRHTQQSSTAA